MGIKTNKWNYFEANNNFDEVVTQTIEEGPQMITREGEDYVVVLSAEVFQKLIHQKNTLYDFFKQSPFADVKLNVNRDKSKGRELII